MRLPQKESDERHGEHCDRRSRIIVSDPQFWSIFILFVLITLHHYDNLTSFRLFSMPDLPLGITRHTVDRMLYLLPIALSSIIFGMRGGTLTVAIAFLTMLPRAFYISSYESSAILEVFVVTLIGSLISLGSMHYRKQEKQLEATKEKLELSEKKYRQLFENAHDAIWVQDLDGKVIAANQAAARLLGYDLSTLIGMDSRRFFSRKDFAVSKVIRSDIEGGDDRYEPYRKKIIKKDRSTAYIMLTTNLISSDGQPDGIQFIARDITKEVRMQENQGFYLRQITKAHEEERQRISRDLHDSTAQSLIATIRSLESFCEEDDALSSQRLDLLLSYKSQLKSVLQEIRQISRDLRPSIIDELGLVAAVEWLVGQFKVENGIVANLSVLGVIRDFSPELEVTLFRIIQEALRNAAKHSGATEVWVTIDYEDKETIINIVDNGKGFQLTTSLGELSRLGKLGIDGMQTRARLVGGILDVQSSPGNGTAIAVTIPG
jgi:PAS domain S-box-containing protein